MQGDIEQIIGQHSGDPRGGRQRDRPPLRIQPKPRFNGREKNGPEPDKNPQSRQARLGPNLENLVVGVVGMGAHSTQMLEGIEHGSLIKGIKKLEKPPALAGQRIFGSHKPGAGPYQQALIPGAVAKLGLGDLGQLAQTTERARSVAGDDRALRPQ